MSVGLAIRLLLRRHVQSTSGGSFLRLSSSPFVLLFHSCNIPMHVEKHSPWTTTNYCNSFVVGVMIRRHLLFKLLVHFFLVDFTFCMYFFNKKQTQTDKKKTLQMQVQPSLLTRIRQKTQVQCPLGTQQLIKNDLVFANTKYQIPNTKY